MGYRGRRNRFDRFEQRPELAIDLGEGATRGRDKDVGAGVVVRVCDETILPGIPAEAEDRDPPAERIIDLAGFVPFQCRDHQSGSVEEAPALKVNAPGSVTKRIWGS